MLHSYHGSCGNPWIVVQNVDEDDKGGGEAVRETTVKAQER